MPNQKDGKLELLTDKNSALVLVDYQPTMFAGVASGDKTIIRNAAYCAAKAANILKRVFSRYNFLCKTMLNISTAS